MKCLHLGNLHIHIHEKAAVEWGLFYNWDLRFLGYGGESWLIVWDRNLKNCFAA